METSYLPIARIDELAEDTPTHAVADGIDLVLVRRGEQVHVFEGRCPHRGALLADGRVEGPNLICGVHGWDYRLDTGVSAYNPAERISKFSCQVEAGKVLVAETELAEYRQRRPERPVVSTYDRLFDDPHQDTAEEPYVSEIHRLAKSGLSGAHGQVAAMGVPRPELPSWDDLQMLTAQLHRFPMLDEEPVDTSVTIGPAAARPLRLQIPVFVSDMSFGALSQEAKTALGRGAEGAGTAICSGEGGMLPEEQAECSRYFYELASGRFGWDFAVLDKVQALHLKLGQGAKTGTGGHLPGPKVVGRIAEVRGLAPGTPAVSPARFTDWTHAARRSGAGRPRSASVPAASRSASRCRPSTSRPTWTRRWTSGVDYVILDGRGGGTGAAPTIFRDTISVPTMAALARARRHLDLAGARDVTLVATGGFRRAQDMVKAMALGADAIAVSNVALQAIGCVGMRACHTDNCPMGIATQKPHLRARLPVQRAAEQLTRYLGAITELMVVLARACGHDSLSHFTPRDLTSWKRDVAELVGVQYAGMPR